MTYRVVAPLWERQKDKRYILMENIAASVLAEHHVERCLVVGVNIDRTGKPYSLLGVFDRGGGEAKQANEGEGQVKEGKTVG